MARSDALVLEGLFLQLVDKHASEPGLRAHIHSSDYELARTEPFAFLLAVLADQSVRVSWAWSYPRLLRARLGHLSPSIIASLSLDDLQAVLALKPALHRFPRRLAEYTQQASAYICDNYKGETHAVLRGGSAAALIGRLRAVPGIGAKKAALAAGLLYREFGVAFDDLAAVDLACDVHVLRVFFRLGFTSNPCAEAATAKARALSPHFPGQLTSASWELGRTVCTATAPRCDDCLLTSACPKTGIGPLHTAATPSRSQLNSGN